MSPPDIRAEVRRWIGAAAGVDGEVQLPIYLTQRRDVFVEGRTPGLTCAASLQLDRAGAIGRSLFFKCQPVEAPDPLDAAERPAVLPVLERYFEWLGEGDFGAAAACFSEDCLYSHPPYRPGEPQAEFRGRRELAAEWPRRRGARRVETVIAICVQHGNHAFIEGVAAGGSFLSSIVLDHDGLIKRYVAFYTPERVPRLTA